MLEIKLLCQLYNFITAFICYLSIFFYFFPFTRLKYCNDYNLNVSNNLLTYSKITDYFKNQVFECEKNKEFVETNGGITFHGILVFSIFFILYYCISYLLEHIIFTIKFNEHIIPEVPKYRNTAKKIQEEAYHNYVYNDGNNISSDSDGEMSFATKKKIHKKRI
uniref:PIR Superfamily Protein n=1 Tax=Strongyloides venezuelensis TaxID=75913 RepID=A0A0K0F1F5_STRVS